MVTRYTFLAKVEEEEEEEDLYQLDSSIES